MSPRFQLRPRAYLGTPSSKQSFNLALFSEVAPKYDLITGILSLGRDASWKRRLVADLPEIPAPQCVDLACGTGDLTHLLARRFQDGHVVGIDLTPAMLEIARNRFPEPNATYTEGTMDRIAFEISNSVKVRQTLVVWMFDASISLTGRFSYTNQTACEAVRPAPGFWL